MSEMDRLRSIMDHLRGPQGCPWDREQTLRSLATYLLEETYEVLEAIESGSARHHCEELGDLLLQIVFQARVAQESGDFDLDDVIKGIREKIVRRHPHVFGSESLSTADQVLEQWEQIKAEERRRDKGHSLLTGVPTMLPALLKALRISTKVARVGFDWPDCEGLFAKVEEEWSELREAVRSGDRGGSAEELGDLFFTLANVGRHLDIDPEAALQAANRKFQERFARLEARSAAEGFQLSPEHRERMEALWLEIKEGVRKPSPVRTGPSAGTSGSAPRRGRRTRAVLAPRAARTIARRGSPPASRDRSARRQAARARSRR